MEAMTTARARRMRGSLLGAVLVLAGAFAAVTTGPAVATNGDVFARGVGYCASTYGGHGTLPGFGPSVDINVGTGNVDDGHALFAPQDGSVTVHTTGGGGGYGNSIIWHSADGAERLHLAHLRNDSPLSNRQVAAGELIGRIGNSGTSSGSHLHISRSVNGAGQPLVLSGRTINPAPGTPSNCSSGPNYFVSNGPVTAPTHPTWVRQDGTWASEISIATIPGGWEMFTIGSDSRIYRKAIGARGWSVIPGPRAKKLATTTSVDGRVELFYIGMNNEVYHHWETSPGGDISRWEALGGYARDIAAARAGDTWEVFHIGENNSIYRGRQVNKAWHVMHGTWALSLAAATSRDGRVELFHTTGGRNVMHAWQSSPGSHFGGWVNRAGVHHDIGATSVGNGEWELYAISDSNTVWRLAPWSGVNAWQRSPGSASRIAAARNSDGRVELIVVGGSNVLYHAWQKSPGYF